MGIPEDPELFARAKNGDKAAVSELVEHLAPHMSSLAKQVRGSHSWLTREDLAQVGWVGFLDALPKFRGTTASEMNRFALESAKNAMVSHVRSRHSRGIAREHIGFELDDGSVIEPVGAPVDHAAVLSDAETTAEMRRRLDLLTPRQQQAVVLTEYAGRTVKEAAVEMEISHQAVYALLRGARRWLRESDGIATVAS